MTLGPWSGQATGTSQLRGQIVQWTPQHLLQIWPPNLTTSQKRKTERAWWLQFTAGIYSSSRKGKKYSHLQVFVVDERGQLLDSIRTDI
ncbi:hypothetical protein R1flu_013460 [Riccia fluitans]|uniref:Uncharacterized protein n=1 Tax=Riccia fluitans TaxID=41844 RepID=A0ABD1YDA5_9MARC